MQRAQFISGENLNNKIFIAIAAQDDEELKYTVKYIFENADHPENVSVGIALTAMKKKSLKEAKQLVKKHNVRLDFVKQKKNDLSMLGIGKGRSRAANLYNNEDYMIQVDCHSLFDKSWDTTLLGLFKEASQVVNNTNVVLTAIPPIYEYCCNKHNNDIVKSGMPTRYAYYLTQEFFINVVPRWGEVDIYQTRSEKFLPQAKVSPAFIMGNKDFAKDPGIYTKATFYDEDLTQSINLFARDFAFVFPNIEDLPVRHLDSKGIVKGHKRFFLLDYLNQENQDLLHENLKKNYLNFVNDPSNADKITKYKKYTKVDALKGCFTHNHDLVPESFR